MKSYLPLRSLGGLTACLLAASVLGQPARGLAQDANSAFIAELVVRSEGDPNQRQKALRAWASSFDVGMIDELLDQISGESAPQICADARFALASRWFLEDPEAAAAALLSRAQPDPAAQNAHLEWKSLLETMVGSWAASDAPRAISWSQGLPNGPLKPELLDRVGVVVRQVTIELANTNPQKAAGYLAQLPQNPWEGELVRAVVSTWAYRAPEAAAAWVNTMAEGPLRTDAVGELIGAWSGKNVIEAAEWLKKLPEGPSRNAAVDALCRVLSPMNPPVAFGWAKSISDEALRQERLEKLVRVWMQLDPAAARTAVTQSDLTATLKDELLKGIVPERPPGS